MKADCGCTVVFGPGFCDEPGDFDGIAFCPLHIAAPELLEALQGLVDAPAPDDMASSEEAWNRAWAVAHAAIAKAEGK